MTGVGTSRIARLAERLSAEGVDAFVGWSAVTMGYLHEFHEGGGERFMALCVRSNGDSRLICPALSATQAARAGIESVVPWRDGEDPLQHFRRLTEDWSLRAAIIAVDPELPAHMLLAMQSAAPAALFKPGGELISALTRVKEPAELALLRQAARIADDAFPKALQELRPGITESELEQALTEEMRRLGGKPAFCIVATGANGAEPHHLSDDTRIVEGDVAVVDFGCTVGGYYSDITRTVCVGKASEEARRVYAIVHDAQARARDAIRPGIECQEIDRIARKVIADAGYGAYFMHRLGHGIGMRGHEDPCLVEGNAHRLEPGNCFSVEPGIYLPGKFGVRIENIVSVAASGHESLNEEPPAELLEI